MKIQIFNVVFLTFLLAASAGNAMTIAEFKAMPGPKQDRMVARLVMREIEHAKEKNYFIEGRCLERQFFTDDIDNDGLPDGPLLIAKLIDHAHKKDKHGQHFEDGVKKGTAYLTNKHCSGMK